MSERDPIHVQAYKDADAAFSVAKSLWQGHTPAPTLDVLQSTFATVCIHIQNLRKAGPSPQAGRAVPAAAGRPAPSPAPAEVPPCPQCGGAMFDNRGNKKSPTGPDFTCRDKECKNDKGYRTGVWLEKAGGKKKAAPRAVPSKGEDFNDFPEQLEEEDDLPF